MVRHCLKYIMCQDFFDPVLFPLLSRPPLSRPERWRRWSVCPRRTPRPAWAKLWSWRTRKWPWSSSSLPTSKRLALIHALFQKQKIKKINIYIYIFWIQSAEWCNWSRPLSRRSWRKTRNAPRGTGILVLRMKRRRRRRRLSARRKLPRRGRHLTDRSSSLYE